MTGVTPCTSIARTTLIRFNSSQYFQRQVGRDHYRLNTFFDFKFFKGFNYRLNLSYYNSFKEDGQYTSSEDIGSTGSGSLGDTKYENYLVENIVTYTVPLKNMKSQVKPPRWYRVMIIL